MKNLLLIGMFAAVLAANGNAQTKKTKGQPAQRIVKGTTQLAGDNGKLNVTYTLGKVDPINITLTNVRFSAVREVVGNDVVAPNKEEKLLVVDFIAHNPNPKAIYFGGGSVKFVGVDQESVNRQGTGTFTRAKTGEPFNAELQPAQKVELRAVIVVPAAGTVPKLMLEHQSGGPVLRYDLKPALKPLPAPFGDAKDETGMTAAATYECEPGTYYPMALIDIKLADNPVGLHGQKFHFNTTGADKIFATVKFTLKGQCPHPAFLRFEGDIYDENGEKYPILKVAQVATEESVGRQLEMGEEYTVRFLTIMPANAKPKMVKLLDTSTNRLSRLYILKLP